MEKQVSIRDRARPEGKRVSRFSTTLTVTSRVWSNCFTIIRPVRAVAVKEICFMGSRPV